MTICCSVLKHNLATIYSSYVVIYQLLQRKILGKKILVNLLQFAKFSPSQILYHMVAIYKNYNSFIYLTLYYNASFQAV